MRAVRWIRRIHCVLSAGSGVCLASLILVGCWGCSPSPEERRFPTSAEALLQPFTADNPDSEAYRGLFLYFLQGFLTYRDSMGASAQYPGWPSAHGKAIDAMEGFTRFAPLAAAWLRSGRSTRVELADGQTVDLAELIRRGLLNGTDPESPAYWGQVTDRDQRWCEAADVALVVWLTKGIIWDRMSESERLQVQLWLSTGLTRQVSDNNWHLFSTFIPLVLRDVGVPVDTIVAVRHYQRFKTFYRGEGWFSDGPGDVYDYYNAWGIHYLLYWISQVSPTWDSAFIASSRRAFLASYKYLLARNGIPIRGRSVCYRIAAPAPLLLDYASRSPSTSASEARRGLDLAWIFFLQRGAVRQGAVTQGYCGPDRRILDNYSGPASCLWSLRSLVAAFVIPERDSFWAYPEHQLPIDRQSYSVRIAAIGWTVVGDARTGTTSIVDDDSLPDAVTEVQSSGAWSEFKTLLTNRPHRPRNQNAKYRRGTYRSDPVFCDCRW